MSSINTKQVTITSLQVHICPFHSAVMQDQCIKDALIMFVNSVIYTEQIEVAQCLICAYLHIVRRHQRRTWVNNCVVSKSSIFHYAVYHLLTQFGCRTISNSSTSTPHSASAPPHKTQRDNEGIAVLPWTGSVKRTHEADSTDEAASQ